MKVRTLLKFYKEYMNVRIISSDTEVLDDGLNGKLMKLLFGSCEVVAFCCVDDKLVINIKETYQEVRNKDKK